MQGSRVYTHFSRDIDWISREVAHDARSVSPSLRLLAKFYTEERLKILRGRWVVRLTDQRMGRPIPYLALWLADDVHLADDRLRRVAGLSLARSSIAATIRDDMGESGSATDPRKGRLASYWERRYRDALAEVFPAREEFRRVVAWEKAEWRRFEGWHSAPLKYSRLDPFSAEFLGESSRYYLACALPPLIAVAHAAGRKEEVPRVHRFLTDFSMGWKIFDDLMDWEVDLGVRELNRSSVLIYVWKKTGRRNPVERTDALSWFLNEDFVEDAYGSMLGFFERARETASGFGGSYLGDFMEELIRFQGDKRDSLLRSGAVTLAKLNEGLASVLGPLARSHSAKQG